MAEPPPDVQDAPVKERREPVPCIECGRINWSSRSLCVYCRLGWPDPGDMRGMPPDREGVGHLRLDEPLPPTGDREAPAVHRTSDGKVLREVAVDAAGRFVEDVQCMRCRYNLRGLRHADVCPECGGLVEESLCVHELAAMDPQWLMTLRTGGWFLVVGMLLTGLSPFLLVVVGLPTLLFLGLGKIFMALGIIKLSQPQWQDRIEGLWPRIRTAGICARATVIAVPTFLIWPFVMSLNIATPQWLVLFMAAVLAAMVGVCGTATMVLLGCYAKLMDRGRLYTECNVIAGVYACGVAVLIAGLIDTTGTSALAALAPCALLLLLVLGIWAVIVVGLVSAELELALKIAQGSAPAAR